MGFYPTGVKAEDKRNAKAVLARMPQHVCGLVANAIANKEPKNAEVYENCIRRCTRELVRAALVIYPNRLSEGVIRG